MTLVTARRKRQVVLVLIGFLLTLSVVGGNAAVGLERTVLDEDFVTNGLEDEGMYEAVADMMAETLRPEDGLGVTAGLERLPEPPLDRMAAAAVSTAYVRGEFERNVGNLYGWLHGDRETLDLRLELGPVKTAFADEVEAWMADLDPSALNARMGRMAANQSSLEAARQEFEAAQLQRIQERTEEDLSQAELERRYDENRDLIRRAALDRLEQRVAESGGPEPLQRALVDYGTVGVDALVTADPSYERFVEAEAEARSALAATVGDAVERRLDSGANDTMALSDNLDDSTRGTLETARMAVSLLDLLAILLPLAALGLAALLGYLSGRRSTALFRVGAIIAVIGLFTAIAMALLAGALPGLLGVETGELPESGTAALGVVTRALSAIGTQSLVLGALGLVLVGAGVAIRRDLLPIADDPDAAE